MIEFAEGLIVEGFSVLPTKKDKRPAIQSWTELQSSRMKLNDIERNFTNSYGIGVICGSISDGLECIDFDAHDNNIKDIYDSFINDAGVQAILSNNSIYIEKSLRGGYHIMYRYESEQYEGSQKLADWKNGDSMIETRGEGGYVVIAPTTGYIALANELESINKISKDERDYLINFAKTFTKVERKEPTQQHEELKGHQFTDPVSWFNYTKTAYAKRLLEDEGWTRIDNPQDKDVEYWRRPGKTDGNSATYGYRNNLFYVFSSSAEPFKDKCYYSPFQILVMLKFKDKFRPAIEWIMSKYFNSEIEYIRVGADYFRRIKKQDRFGIERTEIKAWKKDEIKQDHGTKIFDKIPRFVDFDIVPNNFNHKPVVNNCYNLYSKFSHTHKQGTWKWTKILLEHVFGEQYDLGIRYLQALYLHPDRALPILVLVSKERQTGKTTFINWLNIIFGANMVNLNSEDLTNAFNVSYAWKNIIAIEEAFVDKKNTVEKIKALSTSKFISVNMKFVNNYSLPFFGKIIMASNNEDRFALVDDEEVRFFIRKLEKPKIENHKIEQDMIDEIPAFLYHLTTLPAIDWSVDRTGFKPDEIANENLVRVKKESKTWLFKDMSELFVDFFNNDTKQDVIEVSPTDVKLKWFDKHSKIDINYIGKVLRDEFKFEKQETTVRYYPFGDDTTAKKVGRPYIVKREFFNLTDITDEDNDPLPF